MYLHAVVRINSNCKYMQIMNCGIFLATYFWIKISGKRHLFLRDAKVLLRDSICRSNSLLVNSFRKMRHLGHCVDQATLVSSPPQSPPSSMHPSRSQQFALDNPVAGSLCQFHFSWSITMN